MDVLDYQWDVAVEFWKEIDALAAANDVKVAIEMHPHNVVFSPVTLQEAGGPDRRDARGRGDGPVAPDVAGHGHRGLDQVAGPAGVPRRGEGRDDHAGCRHPRCAGHVVRAGARRRPGQGPHRLRLLVQRLAGEPRLEVRRRGRRARRRVLGGVPARARRDRPGHGREHRARGCVASPARRASHSPRRTSAPPPPRCEVCAGRPSDEPPCMRGCPHAPTSTQPAARAR